MPRPPGSKNVNAVSIGQLTRCPGCRSTARETYEAKRVTFAQGTTAEGDPYTAIVRRKTRCADCGLPRWDKFFEYSSKAARAENTTQHPIDSAPPRKGPCLPPIRAAFMEGMNIDAFNLNPHPVVIAAAANILAAPSGNVATFSACIYAGGEVNPPGYVDRVILDVEGLDVGAGQPPLLFNADPLQIVGHIEEISMLGDGTIAVEGVVSGAGPRSREVASMAKNGFPWRCQLGLKPVRAERLESGEAVMVNRRQVEGPAVIIREAKLITVGVSAFGGDGTSLNIAAAAPALGMLSIAEQAEETKRMEAAEGARREMIRGVCGSAAYLNDLHLQAIEEGWDEAKVVAEVLVIERQMSNWGNFNATL